MTNFFTKSDWQLWFRHSALPMTPYTASECKQCALNLVQHHYRGEAAGPFTFNEFASLCNTVRKQYIVQAKAMLDQNERSLRSKTPRTSVQTVQSVQSVQSLSP